MRLLVRLVLLVLVLGTVTAGVLYYRAGSEPGPTLEIRSPERVIGQRGSLELLVGAPGGQLTRLDVTLDQNGRSLPVFALEQAADGVGEVRQESTDQMWIIRPVGKQAQPELVAGTAQLVVTAARPVFFGLREAVSTVTRDLEVRLDPPRVGVVSLHHYVNHGGAEFVVYRATPEGVATGVRVGERSYPGFPGSAVGLTDPALQVAFFALAYDEDLTTPMSVFARDEAGNEASTPLDHRPFAKPFARSRIGIDLRFIERVVPAIAANTADLDVDSTTPEGLLDGFLRINNDLRRRNNETIAAMAARTRPEMLWQEAFSQLGNTQVESRFADHRTYLFEGREVDQQVHLGFDLASVAQAPVVAANRGVVLFADYLGIYGNTVILDHGLGVQSLYSHLSTITARTGDMVDKGAELGRTGVTGLAGGDHLHFTMLVGGVAVNPVEWWDRKWMEDRVFRKVREAGGAIGSTR
ncbi:MAG: M23 family metallopeptidase [Vicinamibacterales bacterium]|nr:M23 family metallopeptidase [Vicinamibacterales bacterium]